MWHYFGPLHQTFLLKTDAFSYKTFHVRCVGSLLLALKHFKLLLQANAHISILSTKYYLETDNGSWTNINKIIWVYVYIFQVFIVESSAYMHVIITTLDGLQQMASTCDIPVHNISLRFHHACNASFMQTFYWQEEVDLVEYTKVFTYLHATKTL